eukprot:gnl/TRDRNA2_/TRDRNA2_167307_c1_seq4.p1 gnl/TRDRNA2_/TRDRNA2_167307_c1~~gnl/TRDRNA2_/TRDRNA2_167307_c1_seq4.p1  ORF type:complete len:231 (+),score=54.20 gnl/TRDRNA2_/TRDRNA2_167307_c1_seq4:98-790(+)
MPSRKYDPFFLDDPSLKQGQELNNLFRTTHPEIHSSLTLSKLRNLQKDLLNITSRVDELDVSTVATGWVYFEKLVIAGHVRKENRKLLAGACLVLAFKFNQHGEQHVIHELAANIRGLDRKDRLDFTSLFDAEIQVFVWLEFSLSLQKSEVLPHVQRMLDMKHRALADYYPSEILKITHLNVDSQRETYISDEDTVVAGDDTPAARASMSVPDMGHGRADRVERVRFQTE